MSSKGLIFRFTMPKGVALEVYLSGFANKKAQTFELQRLATQGLNYESAKNNGYAESPAKEQMERASEGGYESEVQSENSPLSTFDFHGFGLDVDDE